MSQTKSASDLSILKGKVVLLVPAFRCEQTIAETMRSLLAQGKPLELLHSVIVSDDAGGDRTNEVAKETWKCKTPLTIRKCEKNQGEYRSCNEMIDGLPAEVEWVLIMHGDNLAKPGWLDSLLQQIVRAHPDLATFSTSWDDLREDGTVVPGRPEPDDQYRDYLGTRDTVRDTLYSGCWWHISSCAIRVAAFKTVGGLPANNMRHKGDWFLVAKFFRAGFRVGYIPKALLVYRRNPEGSSALSYQATGDIKEALWIIRQFTPLLKVREVIHLHGQLLHNVVSRGLKATLLFRLNHSVKLAARAADVAASAVIGVLRVLKANPTLNRILDPVLGWTDWLRDKGGKRVGMKLPLNGQQARVDLVKQILEACPAEAIVETGTYLGASTEFFARLVKAPIHSCEVSTRALTYAKLRLAKYDSVRLWRGDSVKFLETLRADRDLPRQKLFFYLDAHWGQELPLREEINLIRKTWKDFVVLIDDFRVPNDSGYGFDDYGPNRRLDPNEFRPEFTGLHVFFPSTPSAKETGLRRGCVVLTDSSAVAQKLEGLSYLRTHPAAKAA